MKSNPLFHAINFVSLEEKLAFKTAVEKLPSYLGVSFDPQGFPTVSLCAWCEQCPIDTGILTMFGYSVSHGICAEHKKQLLASIGQNAFSHAGQN